MKKETLEEKQSSLHQLVNQLSERLPDSNPTKKQLTNHLELFDDAINYLSNKNHQLAFIGNVGAGKTTAICHLIGLLDENEPVLSTGSGRTTLCEVTIEDGNKLEINITPHSQEETREYISEFAQYLLAAESESPLETEDSFKLSAEVERALRNMLDLRITRSRNHDGSRTTVDSAKIFASQFTQVELLTDALEERLSLKSRNKTKFTNEETEEENKWLHTTFKSINNGTNKDVGLAKKINISIPGTIFNSQDPRISITDTKGVDSTVNRTDLDRCLNDNRTVSVLCCRFNEAPDKTMSGLLKLAKDAGLGHRIKKETILLVLDRDSEAEKVIDIDDAVGDKVEGREIRLEQIANDLEHALQLHEMDIKFFDVKSDSPEKLKEFMTKKINSLRDQYEKTITDTINAVAEIQREIDSQSAEAAKAQVKSTLTPWIEKAKACNPALKEFFLPLVSEIRNTGTYAASVRASVNRRGEWHNLDYYQLLASSAREQVVEQIGILKNELIVLIDNMLSQNEIQPAYALLKQIKQTADKRLGETYQQAFSKGRSIYEQPLSSDRTLWGNLSMEWGKGPGYKDRVSYISRNWFTTNKYHEFEATISAQISDSWQRFIFEICGLLGTKF